MVTEVSGVQVSNDNVIPFGKEYEQSEDDILKDVADRINGCVEKKLTKGKCECGYCLYHKNAANMVIDFISEDLINFEKNGEKRKICTHDIKEVLFQSILEVIEREKNEHNGKQPN